MTGAESWHALQETWSEDNGKCSERNEGDERKASIKDDKKDGCY